MRTDGHISRRDEAESRFSQFCERANGKNKAKDTKQKRRAVY